MTDRIRAALAPVDDLLDQLDREHIEETLSRGEPDSFLGVAGQLCHHCGHGWHGLPCAPPIRYWANSGTVGYGDIRTDVGAEPFWCCPCESSDVPASLAVAALAEKLGRPLMPWQRDTVRYYLADWAL